MITLKQLRHLQAIIRHGSIHRAAEALHLTPPALTRSLNVLENGMNIQLFERSNNGMHATPFCLHIQERCAQLISDTDDLMREARIYSNQDTGTLNLGIGRLIREAVLNPIIPDFVALHPKVQIHICEGIPEELIHGLRNRQFDLVIAETGSLVNVDSLRLQHLKSIPTPLFTRNGHPLERRNSVTLDELFGFQMLTATPLNSSHPIRRLVAQRNESSPEPHVVCSDYQLLKQILLSTNAWMHAPLPQFAAEIKRGELITLDAPDLTCNTDISTVELNGRSRSPTAELFIQLCLQRLQQW
ncbi:LysR family transcriptional regulator [Pseudomonas sp. URMO17WK12:I11]|uniref:LysR family transcriptional regulator n=1 Tax=Pseudomonas sp. URMO17WK12:I11 TaxID=1283291 RepID=UPI000721F938|nr:LysR family transcriptional regulator [Pseudomonas sp. URMO17WK12:I11]CRL51634.1 HTH-type transcriptional regulator CysB [Pseudomonas sp. URMO17WK12:I11]